MKKPTKAGTTKSSSPSKAKSKSRPIELTDEIRARIANKAFEIYEQRGRNGGRELEDWLESEALVIAEVQQGQLR